MQDQDEFITRNANFEDVGNLLLTYLDYNAGVGFHGVAANFGGTTDNI